MEHKRIVSQNGVIHYWIARNQNSTSKCIVFTHGLTANHSMFEKQVEYFSSEYHIILWDVPLHGLSRPYTNFTYKQTAMELHNILEVENVSKVFLVGMSMGGYPSQMFGDMFPEMVEGFVALDTTPFGLKYYSKSDLWWLKQVEPLAKCFTDKLLRNGMARSVSKTKHSYNKMIEMLKPLTKAEIIEQMGIAYGTFAMENKDVEFSFPVLILLGDNDNTGKVKKYCKDWSATTGYPLNIIKKASHFSNGDNPGQVNLEIKSFIENHEKNCTQ